MNPLYPHLRYPERAESLGDYEAYQVSLDHWSPLAAPFSAAFQKVFIQGAASILLIDGAQGSGKTLFTQRLERDFNLTLQGNTAPDPGENLWHQLAGGVSPSSDLLSQVTSQTRIRVPDPSEGWLDELRAQVKGDNHARCTVVILDDIHSEEFLCAWAGLDYQGRTPEQLRGLLHAAATHLVRECRGDFRRCLFVFLSNRSDVLASLLAAIEANHERLAVPLTLPVPVPDAKERIVRRNTNALNEVSYWACLDQAGPSEKEQVYRTYAQPTGFTSAFTALNDAYATSLRAASRSGRPSYKNLITLVLLGATPGDTGAFLQRTSPATPERLSGPHAALWLFRETWASALAPPQQRELHRKAKLLESEFALRVVAMDFPATYLLCHQQGNAGTIAADILKKTPLTYSAAEKQAYQTLFDGWSAAVDAGLQEPSVSNAVEEFRRQWEKLGQRRSTSYEPLLGGVFGSFNKGLQAHPSLRPDLILEQYEPCSVTASSAGDATTINQTIRRRAHMVEFTTFLANSLQGLDTYLQGKISTYADMLASV
jgi:hypothetical protein